MCNFIKIYLLVVLGVASVLFRYDFQPIGNYDNTWNASMQDATGRYAPQDFVMRFDRWTGDYELIGKKHTQIDTHIGKLTFKTPAQPTMTAPAPVVPEGFKQVQLANGSYLNYNENYSLEEAIQKASEKNPGVDFSLMPSANR